MKKLIYISLFLLPLFFTNPVIGVGQNAVQKDSLKSSKNTYLGLNIGMGLSPESLLHPASNSVWMDYLKQGFCINLNGRVQLSHYQFGIVFSLNLYSNSFDMPKYLNSISAPPGSITTSVSYGSYTQVSPLVGLSFAHKFNKLTLDIRLLGGVDFLTMPNTDIDSKDLPFIPEYTDRKVYSSDVGVAGDAGISLAYSFCKRLSASLNVDVFIATAGYSTTEYKDYLSGVDYTLFPASSTVDVTMVTTTLGLNYYFGK